MNKLVFRDTEVTKKEFYENKKGINLKDVIVDKIVVSNKVKGNNETVKYYIGYLDESISPLCLILPQMSGWMIYFENGGKNMSFKIEDDEVYTKYNNIWNKIKELLGNIKLDSDVIYDDHYIKTKVKTFKTVKALFSDNIIPEEKVECECISCISADSVLKIDEKYYPQVYLELC